MPPSDTSVFFSDVFEVSPTTLEQFGAFDVSLLNDLPLFIDPFLLFNSENPEYVTLHDQVIAYVRFLRDKAVAGGLSDGLLEGWFTFREVKQTWLGYSLTGNAGTGLGMDFGRALAGNLRTSMRDFGNDGAIAHGSHIEKLCIVDGDIGRDNISDFATNLIKRHLLDFSQRFAREHLRPEQRRVVSVPKAVFNYATETWDTRRYELPWFDGDYILLTPIDLLTKDDVWINRKDMVRDFSTIASSVGNEQLRDQLNNYFAVALERIVQRDEEARAQQAADRGKSRRRRRRARRSGPSEDQERMAAYDTIRQFPDFIDWYIRWKEDHGDEAEAQADERVRSSERLYIGNVRDFAKILRQQTAFYNVLGNTLDEARARVMFLKDVIENKGGHRIFYVDGEPVRREADLHILFRLTWCNTPSDVNPETNAGRGPADFAVSRGRFDKSIVEFKLAKNTGLRRNLQHQVELYQKASDAQFGLKVIVYFTREERVHVEAILRELNLTDDPNIVLIDARDDNKPSASRAGDATDE